MIGQERRGRYLSGRFSAGRFSGRRVLEERIVALIAPTITDLSAGGTVAGAFPASSFDVANYSVQGDPADGIVDAIREWSLNGADWVGEDSPFTQGPEGFAFLTSPQGAFLTAPSGTYLVERAA